MVPLGGQGLDDGTVGVGGVGHQEDAAFAGPGHGAEQGHQLVHQGPVVPVGEHQALVDAGDEGDGGDMTGHPAHQEGDGLEAVAHDVFGLGVAAGFLVERLHPRHLPPLLGGLDAIGQEDQTAPCLERGEQGQGEPDPALGEEVQVQGVAVEQAKEAGIGGGLEPEDADEAGHAGEVHAAAHAHEGEDQPQEGPGSAAGGTQGTDSVIPGGP